MLTLALLSGFALAAGPLDKVDARAADLLARDPRGLGIGIVAGAPSGLSLAYRAEGPAWIDGAVAWSFAKDAARFSLHGDLRYDLSHQTTPDIPDTHFVLSTGVGPRVRFGDPPGDGEDADVYMGIRVPVTLTVYHAGFPLEGFLELAPGLQIVPSSDFVLDGLLGARFYLPLPKKSSPR